MTHLVFFICNQGDQAHVFLDGLTDYYYMHIYRAPKLWSLIRLVEERKETVIDSWGVCVYAHVCMNGNMFVLLPFSNL